MKLLYQNQSAHKLIQVIEDSGKHYLLLEGRDEIHSELDPKHILLLPISEHYWNVLSYFGMHSLVKKVLIVGFGAGTCARQMMHYNPSITIEGIEIDKEIVEVGGRFFDVDLDKCKIYFEDAIDHLKKSKKKYDYIIVDAFIKGNLGRQFITSEFYELVKKHLNPKGFVGINYFGVKDWSKVLKKSLKDHFTHIEEIAMPNTYNYIVLASDHSIDLTSISATDDDSKRLKNFVCKKIRKI